jgi:O-antigen/teichoic acid export membrane protein
MTEPSAAAGQAQTSSAHSWVVEVALRVIGAVLQIAATWAVVHALTPEDAGVYFRGFVIALGLSALLRAKYEIYMAQHIIGRHCAPITTATGVLLMQLGQRMLVRSSLLCGVLLVVTADLDIQAPQLQRMLQIYLPFVLAFPCVSLASFLGEALRAANRTLGVVVVAYAVNLSMLLAVAFASEDASLALYSWAFLAGTVVSACVAVVIAWRTFPFTLAQSSRPIDPAVLEAVHAREWIGLGRGVLLWGPLGVLAVWAPAVEMAQYAVAARTALVVDFFLPALNLTGCRETLTAAPPASGSRRLMVRHLARALVYSSAFFLALLMLAPATLSLYGQPYDSKWIVYAVLLGVQWANGVGRPAVRDVVAKWHGRRIAVVVGSSAFVAVLLCSAGVAEYGALAAASASLIGALILNSRAIAMALSD